MFPCIWNHIYVYDTRLWCWGTAHFVNSLGPKAGADLRRWPTPQDRLYGGVIKWKQFPRYWPFVRGIHRSPVNSPHKGQWCGALIFYLIRAWIDGWVNNHEAGGLRRHRAIMISLQWHPENHTHCLRFYCAMAPDDFTHIRYGYSTGTGIDQVPVK